MLHYAYLGELPWSFKESADLIHAPYRNPIQILGPQRAHSENRVPVTQNVQPSGNQVSKRRSQSDSSAYSPSWFQTPSAQVLLGRVVNVDGDRLVASHPHAVILIEGIDVIGLSQFILRKQRHPDPILIICILEEAQQCEGSLLR